jgi:hypothetical protein
VHPLLYSSAAPFHAPFSRPLPHPTPLTPLNPQPRRDLLLSSPLPRPYPALPRPTPPYPALPRPTPPAPPPPRPARYIRNLFVLVVAYGMSINMVEVTWKGKLKQVS